MKNPDSMYKLLTYEAMCRALNRKKIDEKSPYYSPEVFNDDNEQPEANNFYNFYKKHLQRQSRIESQGEPDPSQFEFKRQGKSTFKTYQERLDNYYQGFEHYKAGNAEALGRQRAFFVLE